MQLAVLGSLNSWYVKDLRRAAADRHEVTAVTFRQLHSDLSASPSSIQSGDFDLAGCDCLLVRSMPPGSLEQVVFRMDVLSGLESSGTLVVNPPKALEVSIDKYLATVRLQNAGLAVPKTISCQTVEDAMSAFDRLGQDVVIKPLFGGEGRGIARLTDESLAWRAFKMLEQSGAVIYLQEFVPHYGYDQRLFVIGRKVIGMCRNQEQDWRTNVSRGATTEPLEVTDELREIALRAAESVGAPLVGVDLLPARDGRLLALEVNAVPGWQALAKTLNLDVASLVLDYLVQKLEQKEITRVG